MTIDRKACLEPSETAGGNLVGRDPRQMGRAGLEAGGFEPMTPMEVIRAKCLDCCAGSAQEVRYCVAVDCPSWPYRMGSPPFRPPVREEHKAALRANALRGRGALAKSHKEPPLDAARPLVGYWSTPPALIAGQEGVLRGFAGLGSHRSSCGCRIGKAAAMTGRRG
jgi:hypothetical protein